MSATEYRKFVPRGETWAVQWDGSLESTAVVQHFCGQTTAGGLRFNVVDPPREGDDLLAKLLNDSGLWVRVQVGEWLLRDHRGRVSIRDDEVFRATYEEAEQ